jgi:hypothetical protein
MRDLPQKSQVNGARYTAQLHSAGKLMQRPTHAQLVDCKCYDMLWCLWQCSTAEVQLHTPSMHKPAAVPGSQQMASIGCPCTLSDTVSADRSRTAAIQLQQGPVHTEQHSHHAVHTEQQYILNNTATMQAQPPTATHAAQDNQQHCQSTSNAGTIALVMPWCSTMRL